MIGSDSSRGLLGACAANGLSSATARHSLSEYTPLVRLDRKWVPRCVQQMMVAKKKNKAGASSTARKMTFVGGDQRKHGQCLEKDFETYGKVGMWRRCWDQRPCRCLGGNVA